MSLWLCAHATLVCMHTTPRKCICTLCSHAALAASLVAVRSPCHSHAHSLPVASPPPAHRACARSTCLVDVSGSVAFSGRFRILAVNGLFIVSAAH